ncbi:hypothetical protein E2C01_051321 [Portunus trituberculatus]|uniref:Uncharacterized protein n=1 Tax=Portunus trituberculatus TaxID=210409 RepID=A0A5B7GIS6_PORTR|nr:hypothetical protein [Portunus trituberculatus]
MKLEQWQRVPCSGRFGVFLRFFGDITHRYLDTFSLDPVVLAFRTLQAVEVVADIESASDKIAGRVRQLVHHSEAGVAPTPFAALIAKSRTALTPEEKVGQVGTAAHGIQVQKSAALLQQVRERDRERSLGIAMKMVLLIMFL